MADSIPVVLICGQVARPFIGTDAFQEAPVFNIMSSCAKHVFLVEEPAELEATVRTAFEIAAVDARSRGDRCPERCAELGRRISRNRRPSFPRFEKRMELLGQAHVSREKCAAFYDMLRKCERPLIYAGGGIINSNAAGELREFAQLLHIPVVTTLTGIGSVDTTQDLSLHMLGMHGTAFANYAVEDCDFILAAGARFDDRVAGKVKEFAPHSRFIAHIDIDAAEIAKVKSVHWAHVGDARTALRDLIQEGKGFSKDFPSGWLTWAS